MRARRSSCAWPRLIFIHLTTRVGHAFLLWAFCGRVPLCLGVPHLEECADVQMAGSRPSRARCECVGVAWEAFNLLESG